MGFAEGDVVKGDRLLPGIGGGERVVAVFDDDGVDGGLERYGDIAGALRIAGQHIAERFVAHDIVGSPVGEHRYDR